MSLPEPKCDLKGNKLTISFMLKVPIDIEVELLGMQPTSNQVKREEFINQIEYSGLHLDTIQNLTPSVPGTPLLNKERGRGEVLSTSNQEPHLTPSVPDTPLLNKERGRGEVLCTSNREPLYLESTIINHLSQAEFDEQVRVLSNQIVTEILHGGEIFSPLEKNQVESDNLENQQPELSDANILLSNEQEVVIQEVNQTEQQKRRFIDSLNDGLTLGVNAVGTVLFLGKLANYSWE